MPRRTSGKTSAPSRRGRPRRRTSGRSSSSSDGRTSAALRAQLAAALDWHDAHVDFESALAQIPPERRGLRPSGLPYSIWQLLEHLRLTQHDILTFCSDPNYSEPKWPDDYWPRSDAQPTAEAWEGSLGAYRADLAALKRLAIDPKVDLFAKIPHGSGQTYLRELILVIDHTAHHIGQILILRRLLGAWPT